MVDLGGLRWGTRALLVALVGACSGSEQPAPATEERPGEPANLGATPSVERPRAAEPASEGAKRATDLRSRLERVFHSLPPPEALESPQPCDERMVPTDGSRLALLDSALLEALGTRLTPADLAGREAALGAQLEDWRGLSTPVFAEMQRLATDGGAKERAEALEAEAVAMLAGGRLGVMLSEERSTDPGRYRGWLVMYAMETELPWCWIGVEAQGSSAAIEANVQRAASAAVAKIVPELQLRWGRDAALE